MRIRQYREDTHVLSLIECIHSIMEAHHTLHVRPLTDLLTEYEIML